MLYVIQCTMHNAQCTMHNVHCARWITDHDMIRNLDRTMSIQKFAKSVGVTVGFGVEITVLWLKKEHHLLGT